MLWVRSEVVQELIDRHERRVAQAADVRAEPAVQALIRDTAYSLCVVTGTRDLDEALLRAPARLAEFPAQEPEGAVVPAA